MNVTDIKLRRAVERFRTEVLEKYSREGIPYEQCNFTNMEPYQIAHTVAQHIEKRFEEYVGEIIQAKKERSFFRL